MADSSKDEELRKAADITAINPSREQIAFVRERVASQLESFDSRRRGNKRKAFTARLGVLALGAMTTVLLGLSLPGYEAVAKNAALVLSAAGTLLAAWEGFFNHRELWVRFTATSTRLRSLLSELEYCALGGGPSRSELDELFRRFHTVLDDAHEQWQELRAKDRSSLRDAESPTGERAGPSGATPPERAP